MKKDYYEILGVSKTATKEELKKAFHKLAHAHHPDKGGDAEKFKEINEAYQTLSDDSKRAQYDRFGSAGPGGYSQAGGNPFEGFDFNDFAGGFSGGSFDFGGMGDIFSEFFGGKGGKKRGDDLSASVKISFKESVFGTEKTIYIKHLQTCEICTGSGAAKGTIWKTCSTCSGSGRVTQVRKSFIGSFQTVAECSTCEGKGEIPEKKCEACHGAGTQKKEEEITLRTEGGVDDGAVLKVAHKGNAIKGGVPGDLYIRLEVEKDKVWKREGMDIVSTLSIPFSKAVLGGEVVLDVLEKEEKIKIKEGSISGSEIVLKGLGVHRGSKKGNAVVIIHIETPQKLSKKARELLEELQKEGI